MTGSPHADTEIVVAGGGLAGAAAACQLAQGGRSVLLLERETVTADKICGEFLSVEAQRYLDRLGLDLDALGGEPIARLRLVRGAAIVETALPFRGLGLSRRVLDSALLDHAAASGAHVRRGCRVNISSASKPRVLDVSGLGQITARTLFLATGKHDLRPLQRQPETPPEDLVGFKTYFELSADQARALEGHIEVILFDQGYAGLQRVEGGRANLCLLTQRSHLQRSGGNWQGLLQALQARIPHLQRRLQGATELLDRPLSIFRVPYGFVHAPTSGDPLGVYRLGDQAGVIASFSGDGMSIALHSSALASRAYLNGDSARAYHLHMRRDIRGQIRRADVMYHVGRWAPAQQLLMHVARVWPRGLQLAAAATRVSARAVTDAIAP
jgi:flavin-dependent dehydrogenase